MVVLDKEHLETRGLLLRDGRLLEIGDAGALRKQHSDASLIRCEHAFISPGFINAHEHTSYSFQFPDPNLSPVYVHRDEWRLGLNGKPKLTYTDTKDPAVLAWIELRHLVSGVTTLAGSGGVKGIVKNASSANPPSQVYVYTADMQTFPFGMDVEMNFGNAACDSDASKLGVPHLGAGTPTSAYVPHVGEGTNCAAKLEIDDYLEYVASAAARKYSLIHGLALNQAHLKTLRDKNISVIWSPRSNLALYGSTLDPTLLLDAGVSVALGTDWSLSGSFNILNEMSCARAVSEARAARPLSGRDLWQMATIEAAKAIDVDSQTGSIAIGKEADLVVVNDPEGVGIDRLGSVDQSDVIAVFVDGKLMAGDVQRFGNIPNESCPNQFDGKFLCIDISEYAPSFEELKAKNAQGVDLVDRKREAACRF
jgi:cytosine/adenosine deaminase-related metal-dependent hydrolase